MPAGRAAAGLSAARLVMVCLRCRVYEESIVVYADLYVMYISTVIDSL